MSTNQFEIFSTKTGFNTALKHFQIISNILEDFEETYNLADLLNEQLNEKNIQQSQLLPTVSALLVDKYSYFYRSYNLMETITDFVQFHEETLKWSAVDMVIVYTHPELGVTLINPKNHLSWALIDSLRNHEIITVYCGSFADGTLKSSVANTAISRFISLLEGTKGKTPQSLLKGPYSYIPIEEESEETEEEEELPAEEVQEEAQAEEKAEKTEVRRNTRMTPYYSVPVTNELFHNGNVEAWKKIIQSYQARYPDLDVYIYYDGERIQDIHALFKWGKVKHGSTILFTVAGENIQGVAKLQRYFKQGASPAFESFLRFPVNKILNLF